MDDRDFSESCHISVVQIFVHVYHGVVEIFPLDVYGWRHGLRLGSVQASVSSLSLFFSFSGFFHKHQVADVYTDFHDPYFDCKIAFVVGKRKDLSGLIQSQNFYSVADFQLIGFDRALIGSLYHPLGEFVLRRFELAAAFRESPVSLSEAFSLGELTQFSADVAGRFPGFPEDVPGFFLGSADYLSFLFLQLRLPLIQFFFLLLHGNVEKNGLVSFFLGFSLVSFYGAYHVFKLYVAPLKEG